MSIPFTLDQSRYDLNTFYGRCRHFYMINDPRTLVTTQTALNNAQNALDHFKTTGQIPTGYTNDSMWESRKLIESTLHPDTLQPIPPVFRFSAFIPANLMIVTTLLHPRVIGSVPLTIGAHWFNQSYNAAINFSNRNASNDIPTARLVEGYVGAVVTSVSIALGATYAVKKLPPGTLVSNIAKIALPFLAVAGAGSANVLLMRRNELQEGIMVFDEEGNYQGKSVKAAQNALAKCSAARVLWNLPIMVIPPLIMSRLSKLQALKTNPRLKMATELGIISVCLFGGVSPALAAFPQRDSLPLLSLEPKFHNLSSERLYFNKGL